MVDSAAMEPAAEIMETSADIEQTVDGTEAFNLMLGIVLALKRMFVSVAFKLGKPDWALESLSYERAKQQFWGKLLEFG